MTAHDIGDLAGQNGGHDLTIPPEDEVALFRVQAASSLADMEALERIAQLRIAAALRRMQAERDDWKRAWELRAHMLDKAEATVARLREALDAIDNEASTEAWRRDPMVGVEHAKRKMFVAGVSFATERARSSLAEGSDT